ncbi:MAG: phosphoribosylformylglycinamidine synthase subunit PurQ [Saprospiraceae bacterium]|nr:phosphoribosylformylglycinamidine synthase subunit PurQ [Candidatus Opimibacter skivensis]MBP6680054.1 phosphoribosylformylglycinamidine synthase subunit PurQ [Saprospiraceae bacterium]MBP8086111.1 phosphoribosylformylglycinamidine synthase subunit PurQ [Saprospiraceae bacterium]
MKFGVVVFPGSNCDDDMIHVLGTVLGAEVHKLWHKDTSLEDYTSEDCIILPGGFSYGDYLRAGAIARYSPIMQSVISFANNGGKVWGICNGFQILCESGLLPGALVRNRDQKFISKNIHLRVETTDSLITNKCSKGQVLKMPVAHAEGRYITDNQGLAELQANDQILFRYCNPHGELFSDNGATDYIAGICNKDRNVFGMMPHPERASEAILGNTDGLVLFQSLYSSVLQSV